MGLRDCDKTVAVRRKGGKTGIMPVVEIGEEKAKTHKTRYMTLYENLLGAAAKIKTRKAFIIYDNKK